MDIKFYSQHGEDILLWKFFGDLLDGLYIDVGAFDGIHLSNSYSFEQMGWRGVCVEAHPGFFPFCQANRPDAVCLHAACVGPDAPSSVAFLTEDLGLLSGIKADETPGMEQRYALRGMSFRGFSTVNVPTVTLDAILARHFPEATRIDLLSVDVEGTEPDVLAGLTVPARVIVVEANDELAAGRLSTLLTGQGYFLSRRLGANLFFTHSAEDARVLRNIHAEGTTEATTHPLGQGATLHRQVGKRVVIRPDRSGEPVAPALAKPPPAAPRMLFSCVVDTAPYFSQQAWLWACSLIEYGGVPPEDIVVHVLPGVNVTLGESLRSLGVRTAPIFPFGDGKYCNKIAQLTSPSLADAEYVALMDADMLVLEDIRHLAVPDAVRAKIVDMPNPPMEILEHVFKEAGLPGHPAVVPTDIRDSAMTFSGNCNGGFYLIPQQFLGILGVLWQKWAIWLLHRKDLLGSYLGHIDQISFCLAMFESGTPLSALERRFNFPTHLVFPKSEHPAVLHHHCKFDRHRQLTIVPEAGPEYATAVGKANALLQARWNVALSGQVPHITPSLAGAGEVLAHKPAVLGTAWDEHIACIVRAHKPGPKVYVHLGTPKTGTTALQEFFAQNILELRHAGIDYFREFIQGTGDQKHQRIFQGMSQQNNELIDRIKEHIRHESAQGAHTFLISSEGYYNYVQECGPSYMQCIRELAKEFSVCLVVFLRPQCYFLESYYRQCLRNPKVEDRPAYCSDLSIETFAALPWMSNQLDYARNIQFFMDNMGGASLALVRYSSQALKSFLRFLCVPHDLATRITRTTPKLSLNRNATELLRVLNRVLSPESRNRVIQILEQTASCSSISRDAFFASPALMDRVTLQHSDSNRLLSMMFWGREELFPGLALNPDAAWSPPEIHGELLPGLLAPLLARLSA